MAVKEFSYRGKNWDEIKDLSADEFAKITTSRARRSIARNPLLKKLLKEVASKKKSYTGKEFPIVKTHSRDVIIVPEMVGIKIAIHKGNKFEEKLIDREMLGHFLGEFSLTRKRLQHGKAGIGATKSSTSVATKKT